MHGGCIATVFRAPHPVRLSEGVASITRVRRIPINLVSFKRGGLPTFGVVIADRISDLEALDPSLKAAIASRVMPASRQVAAADARELPNFELDLAAPDPQRLVCAGLSFGAHAFLNRGAEGLTKPYTPSEFR